MRFPTELLIQKQGMVDIAGSINKEVSQCPGKYQKYGRTIKYIEIYVKIRGKCYSLINKNRFVIFATKMEKNLKSLPYTYGFLIEK